LTDRKSIEQDSTDRISVWLRKIFRMCLLGIESGHFPVNASGQEWLLPLD
jgi:hypothetical protein